MKYKLISISFGKCVAVIEYIADYKSSNQSSTANNCGGYLHSIDRIENTNRNF